MVKPNLRTKSIGTKVSEEEFARLEQAAQKASKTLGEWCREVMLASANGQSEKGNGTGAKPMRSWLRWWRFERSS